MKHVNHNNKGMSAFGTIPLECKLWCKCKLNGDWPIKFGVGDYEDARVSVWENKLSLVLTVEADR